jgi:hypothetical protein
VPAGRRLSVGTEIDPVLTILIQERTRGLGRELAGAKAPQAPRDLTSRCDPGVPALGLADVRILFARSVCDSDNGHNVTLAAASQDVRWT